MSFARFEVLLLTLIFGLLRDGAQGSIGATNKLSLASWGSYHSRGSKGPGTYSFGYDVEDPVTGNVQFRQEERHPGGGVTGSYGYVDSYGVPQVVHYVADTFGYRVISAQPATVLQQQQQQQQQKMWPKSDGSAAATAWIRNPDPIVYPIWR